LRIRTSAPARRGSTTTVTASSTFRGNYLKFDPNAKREFFSAEAFPRPLDYEGDADRLFHNNGDGTFTDVSHKAGITTPMGRAWSDRRRYDNDAGPNLHRQRQMESNTLPTTITTAPSPSAPDVNTPSAPMEATSPNLSAITHTALYSLRHAISRLHIRKASGSTPRWNRRSAFRAVRAWGEALRL